MGDDEQRDGRRRKGDRRRQLLLDATLRVVGRDGVAGVTQRAVAAEAGLPPSAVLYYFPTVDDLLVATLVSANDSWLAALGAVGDVADLAALIDDYAGGDRALALAEYELWLTAARRPALRGELDRWYAALDRLAAALVADAAARPAFAAAVDGLFLRAATGAPTDTERVLRSIAAGSTADAHGAAELPGARVPRRDRL